MVRHFTTCRVDRIPAGCSTGCCLSHPTKNIYETYCCIQILTIPTADFIGQTATSGNAGPSMPHDLNVYPRCAAWQFTVRRRRKLQSFETSLSSHGWVASNNSRMVFNIFWEGFIRSEKFLRIWNQRQRVCDVPSKVKTSIL